jgi:maltose alpha-D-glucosyltransferase/alpha-amylase
VLNHTSNQHPWFQRARRAPAGSAEREFYVWSDTDQKYAGTRVIFRDSESSNWAWDTVAGAYYWHRFFSHQPDLNYHNPAVVEAMLEVIDFWLGLGVDGLRLEAVPYLFEAEGGGCENLPETHSLLKQIRLWVQSHYPNRLLIADANQWPEEAAAYMDGGDECQMAVNYPLMPRLFMALQMEECFPILDIIQAPPAIPPSCQWAMFLRNHDELTLEMVTDEERDYLYRTYGQDPSMRLNAGIRRRLAPLLNNDRRKIELLNVLLLSLPVSPVIYYGDEIGMGDNIYLGDRNGVRTPMQWSGRLNAGFSEATPQRLFLPPVIDPLFHYSAVNVENQENSTSSLLWWMRRALVMRKRHAAFGRGRMDLVASDNPKVLSFLRTLEDEQILVVANLSRNPQVARLDLHGHFGAVPSELFSRNPFPAVRRVPYPLSLGPFGHYWLALRKPQRPAGLHKKPPMLQLEGSWQGLFSGGQLDRLLDEILPEYLRGCRWFSGKARIIRDIRLADVVLADGAALSFLEVAYAEGENEIYLLPLHFLPALSAAHLQEESPQAIICSLRVDGEIGVLADASYDAHFQRGLVSLIAANASWSGRNGRVRGYTGHKRPELLAEAQLLPCRVLKADQSNTALRYGNQLFMKIYRKPDLGQSPELQIVQFLTEQTDFTHVPVFVGALEYQSGPGEVQTLGLLQGFVENVGDAWQFTQDVVTRFLERVLVVRPSSQDLPAAGAEAWQQPEAFAGIAELVNAGYGDMVRLLGRRTAQMHRALATPSLQESFTPEKFTLLSQRALYQSMLNQSERAIGLLRKSLPQLSEALAREVSRVIGAEARIVQTLRCLTAEPMAALKIRIHGDYHLGQVLHTGRDFVIMDFEGEPIRPVGERKLKSTAFRDVAGMLRSFHYSGYAALYLGSVFRGEDYAFLEGWCERWYGFVSAHFMAGYLQAMADSPIIPHDLGQAECLLNAFLLAKALYEVGYELNNRPDWTIIPLRGIQSILGQLP